MPMPPAKPAPPFPPEVRARLEVDAKEVIGRYPQARSALLPLLHLVQAEEGYVTGTGIEFCADVLGLTTAEVSAVSTFYTMYRRRQGGDFHVGVCTNTLCAVMGGDEIFASLKDHLGIGNKETTADGVVTLEHIECNAACDYAPVVMVNWEFFDDATPQSAKELVDGLRAGQDAVPTRGARLCTFRDTSRILAGFPDERPGAVDEGGAGGAASLVGLRIANGTHTDTQATPAQVTPPRRSTETADGRPTETATEQPPAPSSHDAPAETAESDPANATQPDKDKDGDQAP
ncbi:NADH-quinone oxidoreductase subunit NuoE [Streptomyces sp. SID3343]|uniref:NADH-quinone oxidoreductase subunit NuoE n=1 Tax=Streptomyces sp. SID3343 TaxID=2690260 RepID=UPI00137036BD|nr:NADH-quinone oxidoreductase subunit NuoE [Streptomyces sp. SID3343]MYW01870.1 NADH-quinone oxidoreductase subunit NuoE [Streptomyces sp. SID3343]